MVPEILTPDLEQVGRQRMRSQRLVADRFDAPAEVVRWMGAMQAQDYGQSLWAIGSRLRKPSLAAVEKAIADGSILRTWPMRGTIHWVPAEDAAWMVALSADRTLAASRTRQSQLELTDTIVERAGKLLTAALAGGRRLARPAVMELWKSAGIAIDGQRGYHLLWTLAHTGSIAIGPMDRKQQTFVLLDEWAPESNRLTAEDGGVELARRYLRSHAPATVRDFAWWSGGTLTEARRRVAAAVEGTDLELGDRDTVSARSGASRRRGGVELLAGFDEFVLGYQDRSAVLAAEFADRVVPGNNGIFQPCLVADGRVAGTWKRVQRKAVVDVSVSLFERGSVGVEAVAVAAERYARFLGLTVGRLDVTG